MFLGRAIGARAQEIFIDLLRLVDLAVVAAAGLLAFALRHGNLSPLPIQLAVMVVVPVAMSQALHLAGAYAPGRVLNILAATRAVGWAAALAALMLLGLGFATKTSVEISRVWMVVWAAVALPLLVGARVALRVWLERRGGTGPLRRRIVVIGAQPLLGRLMERIERHPERIDVAAALDIGSDHGDGAALAVALATLDETTRTALPDTVVIAVPGERAALIPVIAAEIRRYWTNVEVCPDHAFINLPFAEGRTMAGIPVLRLVTRPMEGWHGVVKWLEDKVLALALLIPALPVMAVVAALIALTSRGPVLFRQRRFGLSGREFTLYKFRTMVHAEDDGRQAGPGDARVTPLGRLLRRTSLDELPQLFNVLNGTMSLVGPRPHAVPHELHFAPRIDEYLVRHRIKPGITGWAQVHGLRGETVTVEDMRRRIEHDIFYIEHWSLELDLLILVRTLAACIGGRNAY